MNKFLVAAALGGASAFPTFLECERTLAVGETIMSAEAVLGTDRLALFERDGEEIACGSTYVAGETLTAKMDNVEGSARYLMELSSGVFADDGGCEGDNVCDLTRCAKSDTVTGDGQEFVAPTDGSEIVLTIGWATGFGAVTVLETCSLIAADAPVDPIDPTEAPSASAIEATTSPTFIEVAPSPAPTSLVEAPTVAGEVVPYAIVTNGTCVSNGMIDILDEDTCRAVMNDGYYNTRDQNGNGMLDMDEDYPIPTVSGLPPGCWPVEPGTEGFEDTEFPFACITPLEDAVGDCSANFPCFCQLPEYEIVTEGTCASAGYTDVLDETLCRALMNDGYYDTRDQDGNGIIDAEQDYPIPVVSGLPPGCWPVEPGTAGFEGTDFPFACITPLEDAAGDCSDNFPCFCLTESGEAQSPEEEVVVEPPAVDYAIVTNGTCVSHGMIDILDEDTCRSVMNDGYYNTRDQNGNGVLDFTEDYPIPVVSGLPPGCWPVEPGTEGFEDTEFPFACITPLEEAVGECSENFPCFCQLPEYEIVTEGTCVSAGYTDVLDETLCRALMNDGYYGTRDQDGNGIIDSEQDYPIPVVSGLPPGCWPVEPGTAGFEETDFPFACITPLEDAAGDCSDDFPCFCLTESVNATVAPTAEAPSAVPAPTAEAPTVVPAPTAMAPVPMPTPDDGLTIPPAIGGSGDGGSKKKSSSNNVGLIVGIVIAAVILLCLILLCIAMNRKKSEEEIEYSKGPEPRGEEKNGETEMLTMT